MPKPTYRVRVHHLTFLCNAQPRLKNGFTLFFWGGGVMLLSQNPVIGGRDPEFRVWDIEGVFSFAPCQLQFTRLDLADPSG